MIKTDLKIETNHVIGFAVLAVAGYGIYKFKNFIAENKNALNPASGENVVYKSVESAVGQDAVLNTADYIFGAIDLINPFNESDTHAKMVYGIGEGVL